MPLCALQALDEICLFVYANGRLWPSVFGFGRLGSSNNKIKEKSIYAYQPDKGQKGRDGVALVVGRCGRQTGLNPLKQQQNKSVKSFCIVRIRRPAENSIQLNRQQIAVNSKSPSLFWSSDKFLLKYISDNQIRTL